MTDIYLQITETPTVVTLSAPVVSGALSSTVTVANTVTVALDSNSLSALENVTVTVGAAITGTVTVSNFPASQTVTFSAVTISNFPATQAVSLASVPTHGVTLASTTVTISSIPAISGTVTANALVQQGFDLGEDIAAGMTEYGGIPISGTVLAIGYQSRELPIEDDGETGYGKYIPIGYRDEGNARIVDLNQPLPIRGTVTIGSALPTGTNRIGVVTIGAGTVTIGAGTAQIGSVTASISGTVPVSGTFFQATQPASLASLPALAAGTNQIGSVTASISGTVPISISSVTVGNSVTIASLPALAAGTAQIGSVTASISANPSGALTTRFGSVTTANTAQITTAVTNTSRKYLFAQNISIGSVTMGIGFSPTTTQGIQLSPGSGITFDSFCPTGAVWWLGATTGSNFTILEG
jgi:hypothetical protein